MSWAIWITGLPGSGKSTIARATVERLAAQDVRATLLELDAMRRVVTPVPTYSDTERELVYRALVWTAATCVDAGVPVIVDATAHRREWRDLARTVIPAFAEVQLTCSAAACREREANRAEGNAPRGVYAIAGSPGARVPGVDVAYEPARAAELTVDTEATTAREAAAQVCSLTERLPRAGRASAAAGWTLWITGRPGSGKTTIASAVAETLDRYGVGVRVLELGDVLGFIAGCAVTPLAELIAHRALVYAAKVLNEAGVSILVDATAPVRAWRELARALIPRFAEVQLLCPASICATRERAVRWRLMGCAHSPPRRHTDAPDIVPDYEPSLRPEVTIHTDVQDPGSAAATVVSLARRMHRSLEASWTSVIAG